MSNFCRIFGEKLIPPRLRTEYTVIRVQVNPHYPTDDKGVIDDEGVVTESSRQRSVYCSK